MLSNPSARDASSRPSTETVGRAAVTRVVVTISVALQPVLALRAAPDSSLDMHLGSSVARWLRTARGRPGGARLSSRRLHVELVDDDGHVSLTCAPTAPTAPTWRSTRVPGLISRGLSIPLAAAIDCQSPVTPAARARLGREAPAGTALSGRVPGVGPAEALPAPPPLPVGTISSWPDIPMLTVALNGRPSGEK